VVEVRKLIQARPPSLKRVCVTTEPGRSLHPNRTWEDGRPTFASAYSGLTRLAVNWFIAGSMKGTRVAAEGIRSR
jgi:hypothetical protein